MPWLQRFFKGIYLVTTQPCNEFCERGHSASICRASHSWSHNGFETTLADEDPSA